MTLDEDKAICEAVQRNLDSGVYTTGVLSPRHEQGVAAFQRWLVDAIR
jgi:choline monooxygenase